MSKQNHQNQETLKNEIYQLVFEAMVLMGQSGGWTKIERLAEDKVYPTPRP